MPYASPSTRPRIGMLGASDEREERQGRESRYCGGKFAESAFRICRVATSG